MAAVLKGSSELSVEILRLKRQYQELEAAKGRLADAEAKLDTVRKADRPTRKVGAGSGGGEEDLVPFLLTDIESRMDEVLLRVKEQVSSIVPGADAAARGVIVGAISNSGMEDSEGGSKRLRELTAVVESQRGICEDAVVGLEEEKLLNKQKETSMLTLQRKITQVEEQAESSRKANQHLQEKIRKLEESMEEGKVAGTERQNLLAEYNEANQHLRSLITKLDTALTLSHAKLQEKEHEISRLSDLHGQFEMRVSTVENTRNAEEAVLSEKEEILAGVIKEKNALKTSLEVVTNLYEMHFKVMGPSNQDITATKPLMVKTVSYNDACTDTEELLFDLSPLSVSMPVDVGQSISGSANCLIPNSIASNSTVINFPVDFKQESTTTQCTEGPTKAELKMPSVTMTMSSENSKMECATMMSSVTEATKQLLTTMTMMSVTKEETTTSLNGEAGSAMIKVSSGKEWKTNSLSHSVENESSTGLAVELLEQYSGISQGEPDEDANILQDSETTLALPPDRIGLPDLHSQDVTDAELTLMEDLSNLEAQEIDDTQVDESDVKAFASTSVEPEHQVSVMEDLSNSAAQESGDTQVDEFNVKAFASTSVESAIQDSGKAADMVEMKVHDDSLDGKPQKVVNVAYQDLDDDSKNLRRSRDQQLAKKRKAQDYSAFEEDDHDVSRSPSKKANR